MTSRISSKTSSWTPGFSFGLICAFLVLFQVSNAISFALGKELSAQLILLDYVIFFWLMGYWFAEDCRKFKISWGIDSGMFLYMLWPVLIPFHLFKTRGVKGVIPILIFLGAYLGAYLIGLLVFFGIRYWFVAGP